MEKGLEMKKVTIISGGLGGLAAGELVLLFPVAGYVIIEFPIRESYKISGIKI